MSEYNPGRENVISDIKNAMLKYDIEQRTYYDMLEITYDSNQTDERSREKFIQELQKMDDKDLIPWYWRHFVDYMLKHRTELAKRNSENKLTERKKEQLNMLNKEPYLREIIEYEKHPKNPSKNTIISNILIAMRKYDTRKEEIFIAVADNTIAYNSEAEFDENLSVLLKKLNEMDKQELSSTYDIFVNHMAEYRVDLLKQKSDDKITETGKKHLALLNNEPYLREIIEKEKEDN